MYSYRLKGISLVVSKITLNFGGQKSGSGLKVGSVVESVMESVVKSEVKSENWGSSWVNNQVRCQISLFESIFKSVVESAVESEVKSEVKSVVKSAVKSVVKSEVKSVVKSAVKSVVKSAVKSVVKSAVKSEVKPLVKSELLEHHTTRSWALEGDAYPCPCCDALLVAPLLPPLDQAGPGWLPLDIIWPGCRHPLTALEEWRSSLATGKQSKLQKNHSLLTDLGENTKHDLHAPTLRGRPFNIGD